MTILNLVKTSLNIEVIISELKNSLFFRNYALSNELWAPLWNINEEIPDWIEFEAPIRGTLLSLAGEYLLDVGKSKNLPNFQERAKDALTKAIDIFLSINYGIKAMDCRRLAAYAYYQQGSISEYLTLLEDAESFFADKTDDIYLQIQTNFLLVQINRNEISQAINRIKEIEGFVEVYGSIKTKINFNLQSGIVYRRNRDYLISQNYYEKALSYTRSINNKHYEALITNSLATNLSCLKKHNEALLMIDYALTLANNNPGWRANFLDTKANIYIRAEEYANAHDYINQAISLFRKGDDKAGLCEALWTQTIVYLEFDCIHYAIQTFMELYNLAIQYNSEEAAMTYLYDFSNLFFYSKKGTYDEKIDMFRKFVFENTLKSSPKITKAAKILGMDHRTLSRMLKDEFPDLKDLFDLDRKERSDSNSPKMGYLSKSKK